MAYKTILTVLTQAEDVAPHLDAILPFARGEGAHLDILCLGIDRTRVGYVAADGMTFITEESQRLAMENAEAIREAVNEKMRPEDITWGAESVLAYSAGLTAVVADRARYSDLVAVPKPYGEGADPDAPIILEAALFDADVPALVLPNGVEPVLPFKHAVVGWNERPEAFAAVRAALPLLIPAEETDIAVVNPERHGSKTADPGEQLAVWLARHGAKPEVSLVPQTMPTVAQELLRHCRDEGADLLVMGAYGHSRFREAILGGATRDMLELTEIPLFLAR